MSRILFRHKEREREKEREGNTVWQFLFVKDTFNERLEWATYKIKFWSEYKSPKKKHDFNLFFYSPHIETEFLTHLSMFNLI